MNEQIWQKLMDDPDNPELQKRFRSIACHVILEAEQLYEHLEQWLPAQKHFSLEDIEIIREIDEFNEKVSDILLKGMLITKNFVAISDEASLLKGTSLQEIMKRNGWKVLDIQGSLYQMDRSELFSLVSSILEAADHGESRYKEYLIRKESRGLLVLKDQPDYGKAD